MKYISIFKAVAETTTVDVDAPGDLLIAVSDTLARQAEIEHMLCFERAPFSVSN